MTDGKPFAVHGYCGIKIMHVIGQGIHTFITLTVSKVTWKILPS